MDNLKNSFLADAGETQEEESPGSLRITATRNEYVKSLGNLESLLFSITNT